MIYGKTLSCRDRFKRSAPCDRLPRPGPQPNGLGGGRIRRPLRSRTVTIAPNTIIQFGGFDTGTSTCNTLPQSPGWMRYVTVTVDQPSFSYVANVSETPPITEPVNIVPPVGLAVAHNTRF